MVIEGLHFQTGQHISLYIQDGHIAKINVEPGACTTLPIIAPGLVDLQINGYGGMDLNESNLSADTVSDITRALFKEGITSFFPTLITNSNEAIEYGLRQISGCCIRDDLASRCIPGIHLEGPFISMDDGARGAHPRSHVKPPDWALFQKWQGVSNGAIRILTLSPEWPNSLDFIHRCVGSGVTVSIGHTAASPERIHEAVVSGATMSTHLGNGSHTMLPRHENYLWEQLGDDGLWASFIADGFHLPTSFLKMALRTKGERSMLVSDAVALSGMPPGEYTSTIGERVVMTPQGKLHLAGNEQILAGSAQMLPWGISFLVRNWLTTLAEAWVMSSLRPAEFMNLPSRRGLVVGAPADIVTFEWNGSRIHILQTVKHGKCVYSS